MTVSPLRLQGWRGPGCGSDCLPRSHDPESHERYGYERALADRRPRIVKTGPLAVDLNTKTVTVAGIPALITDAQWLLLAHMAERVGVFCPAVDLTEALEGQRRSERTDEARLRLLIHRLRVKLGVAGRLIESGANGRPGRRLVYVEPTP